MKKQKKQYMKLLLIILFLTGIMCSCECVNNNTKIDFPTDDISSLKFDDKTSINNKKILNKLFYSLLEENNNISCYRSNMVKYVPINEKGKIRYPDILEIENCIDNIVYELSIVKPKVVVLLGRLVEKHLKKKIIELGYNTITIYHPSYIHVYRKKEIEKYVEESSKNILKYV